MKLKKIYNILVFMVCLSSISSEIIANNIYKCFQFEVSGRYFGRSLMLGGLNEYDFSINSKACDKLPILFDIAILQSGKIQNNLLEQELADCWYMGCLNGIYSENEILKQLCGVNYLDVNSAQNIQIQQCYEYTEKYFNQSQKINTEFVMYLYSYAESTSYPEYCLEGVLSFIKNKLSLPTFRK